MCMCVEDGGVKRIFFIGPVEFHISEQCKSGERL